MTGGSPSRPRIYYFVHLTGRDLNNTGIQRVVRNLGRSLQQAGTGEILPVRWCHERQAIVHAEADYCDVLAFHGGPTFPPHAMAGRPVHLSWAERADDCLLIPEVPHLGSHDARYAPVQIAAVIGYGRAHGMRCAVIFHDLLPLTHPAVDQPPAFEVASFNAYGLAIANADLICPVSVTTASQLQGWWALNGFDESVRATIATICLPEEMTALPRRRAAREATGGPLHFVTIGTVCRRKNQVLLLETFNKAIARHPHLDMTLSVVGAVAPEVAARASYEAGVSRGRIRLHGIVPDDILLTLFTRSIASIFVSRAEGFGLPVAESLWLGVPCICSNTGSVAEVGRGGGCLLVDPVNGEQIERAIVAIATQPATRAHLREAIDRRALRTWHDYADEVWRRISALDTAAEAGAPRPHLVLRGRELLRHDAFASAGLADPQFDVGRHAAITEPHLFYGPYIPIAPGSYVCDIRGTLRGKLEVKLCSADNNVLASATVERFPAAIPFVVDRPLDGFEVVGVRLPETQFVNVHSVRLSGGSGSRTDDDGR